MRWFDICGVEPLFAELQLESGAGGYGPGYQGGVSIYGVLQEINIQQVSVIQNFLGSLRGFQKHSNPMS